MCQEMTAIALGDSAQVRLKKDITHWICECHVGMRLQTMKDRQRTISTQRKTSSSSSRELAKGWENHVILAVLTSEKVHSVLASWIQSMKRQCNKMKCILYIHCPVTGFICDVFILHKSRCLPQNPWSLHNGQIEREWV